MILCPEAVPHSLESVQQTGSLVEQAALEGLIAFYTWSLSSGTWDYLTYCGLSAELVIVGENPSFYGRVKVIRDDVAEMASRSVALNALVIGVAR